jgi:hypothetical protein
MDPVQAAGSGAELRKIAAALRADKFPIEAVYLIKLESDEGYVDWVIRLVARAKLREATFKALELRRAGKFPAFGRQFRIDAIRPDHPEASRVIAHAQRYGYAPVEFEGVLLDGLLVDYALVADFPGAHEAAA